MANHFASQYPLCAAFGLLFSESEGADCFFLGTLTGLCEGILEGMNHHFPTGHFSCDQDNFEMNLFCLTTGHPHFLQSLPS